MAELRLEGLRVDLAGTTVLDAVDTVVPDGAFAAVIGPSGSGKSTLLRVVAGLVEASAGRVWFGARDVTESPPRERDVGMVFQVPALFPHRNVRRNVSFPLELRRETLTSIRQRVDAETRAMHIEHLLTRHPRQLSRGEEQLVQIARAMVRAPRILLLDEPFAPLDEHLRRRTRAEIKLLQAGYGVTTLMATNDPADVTAMASHVIVLDRVGPGDAFTVVQAGAPRAVERDPASISVAMTVGSLWRVPAEVSSDGTGFWLDLAGAPGSRLRAWSPLLGDHVGRRVVVGFRAGDLVARPGGEVRSIVDRVVPGAVEPLMCRVGSSIVAASAGARRPESFERHASLELGVDGYLVFDAALGTRLV